MTLLSPKKGTLRDPPQGITVIAKMANRRQSPFFGCGLVNHPAQV
jgi:hypothetical protein